MYHVFDFQVYCDCAYAKSRKKEGDDVEVPLYVHISLYACLASSLLGLQSRVRRPGNYVCMYKKASAHDQSVIQI